LKNTDFFKKDIVIPKVKEVYIAIVREYNDAYRVYDWSAYIINNKSEDLEVVIIVSRGYSELKKTATFRKKIDTLPSKSYEKIELIPDELLSINNLFRVSFFGGNTLYEKSFEFRKGTISEAFAEEIPLLGLKGVLRH